MYPSWTGTACYSLLTSAETKWVKQLIIYGAIIRSINMVITGISRGISQLQVILARRRIPQGEIVATMRTLQLVRWDPVVSECSSWRLWDFFVSHVPKSVSQCQRKLKLPHNCTYLTASKVILKILQARLQQYMNHEIPDVQAGFRKGRGTRDQIANIRWIIGKQESSKKTSASALLTMPMPLIVITVCRSQ